MNFPWDFCIFAKNRYYGKENYKNNRTANNRYT